MRGKLRSMITEITPPIMLRGAKAVFSPRSTKYTHQEETGEKGPDWYDAPLAKSDDWRLHYSQSDYYFLWTVIADHVARSGVDSILEIGCGSGQLACLMRDKGISKYHGFDFSPKRIELAKQACPEFAFSVQDAFQTDLYTTYDYEAVICTEFLEHVEGDLDVLLRIKPGTKFYGTVPNFPFTSHVRHFDSKREVLSRYRPCFTDLRVDSFLANAKGKTFYLLEGNVKGTTT